MRLADMEKAQIERGALLLRLAPEELKLGHLVVRLDNGWQASPFRGPEMLVETFEQKRQLHKCCKWVVIDLNRSFNRTRPKGNRVEPLRETLPELPKRIDILQRSQLTAESMRLGVEVHRFLTRSALETLVSFGQSGDIDLPKIIEASLQLAGAQEQALAALIWLTRIKERRMYLAQHCVNTAILLTGFVHALKWDRERVERAALIGLLHDVSKSRLDQDVLNRPGSLSDEELECLYAHPEMVHERLKAQPEVPWEVLGAILSSHERPDGKGYPRGLSGDDVPLMARMINIVDAYDAMTSDRPHADAMTHQQAVGVLWRARGQQFDQKLVEAFVQFLGWIPPGTLVRLTDGRMAVAMELLTDGRIQPHVRIIQGSPGEIELGERLILPPQFIGSDKAALRIEELLPDNFQGYDMRRLTEVLFGRLDLVADETESPPALALREAENSTVAPASELDSGEADLATEPGSIEAAQETATPTAGTHSEEQPDRTCLIVDDSASIRHALKSILEKAGFSVRCVDAGEDAEASIRQQPVDLLFLDILLPGISGFGVLRKLRRARLLNETAVVMISGNPEATQTYFLEHIGADDFLPKPFQPSDVTSCIARLSRNGRLRLTSRGP